jgi:prepilin-type processing-associated H-X9-DG protein
MDVDGKGNNADSDAGAGQNDHWTNYVINGDIVIRHNYFPNLKKYSQIKKHSTTAQVFDGLASVEYWEYSVIKLNEVNPLNDPPGLWDHNKIGYVHNSKANILYLDSHVESVGRNEMPDAISSKALPSWDDDLFE